MPKPRKRQVSLDATPYYHCGSRCVRKAFLCGEDSDTGRSFEHRRGWIEQRLLQLAQAFSIDICAYAIMSNHYHVVLHINKTENDGWSDLEVISRWHQLFNGSYLSQEYASGRPLVKAQLKALKREVKEWRNRLMSISWFMRCLNEHIARAANQEDQCKGRFWESRYTSQALVDEKALAACMAYVDLNPIRACMADSPENSDHTSIKSRINQARSAVTPCTFDQQPSHLYPFVGNPREPMPEGLPFLLTDYIELVEWTGRQVRDDKRGTINQTLPPILERLGLDQKSWLHASTQFESRFKSIVGAAHTVRQACEHFGKRWTHGLKECEVLFSSG